MSLLQSPSPHPLSAKTKQRSVTNTALVSLSLWVPCSHIEDSGFNAMGLADLAEFKCATLRDSATDPRKILEEELLSASDLDALSEAVTDQEDLDSRSSTSSIRTPSPSKSGAVATPFGQKKKVRFHPESQVRIHGRTLFGGGGVPIYDSVSLGLSDELLDVRWEALRDRAGKDEYASTGVLGVRERATLLKQHMDEDVFKKELRETVAPELIRTQKERQDAELSEQDVAKTPSSLKEAQMMAQKLRQSCLHSQTQKARATPQRGKRRTTRSRGMKAGG